MRSRQVEWECALNGASDQDDDILGMGWEPTEQSKWERLAAVVDSGAAEKSYQQASAVM